MAQDNRIMSAAVRSFQADRESRRETLDRREKEVYSRLP